MEKFLVRLLVAGFVFFTLLIITFAFYLGPKAKKEIERRGTEALDAQVKVGRVDLSFWPPLSVVISNVSIEKKIGLEADVKVASVSLSLQFKELIKLKISPEIVLNKPEIEIRLPEESTLEKPDEPESRAGPHAVAVPA